MAGLYLHIPFCEHKCIYCDFYSIAPSDPKNSSTALTDRFVKNLEREIALQAAARNDRSSFDTIFFGGGTPSLLAPAAIGTILSLLAKHFSIGQGAEITLETNPGTVEANKLKDFHAVGINRLSVGIQSFHDDDLKFLTRIHTADEARRCIAQAHRAGFGNISLDLIFALPRQTAKRWTYNLEQAVQLEPAHLSCYSLIVEPNTPLFSMVHNGQVTPLPADEDAEMYRFTIDYLEEHGFAQYEVSNFAKPGYQSRHNHNYWNHTPYLGFGPSAHSYWDRTRWWNIANIGSYCEMLERDMLPVAGKEELTGEQLQLETIFLGLRSDGIDLHSYNERFKEYFTERYKAIIDECVRNGFAVLNEKKFFLTKQGYPFCDEICQQFR